MNSIIFGPSLEETPGELDALASKVTSGALSAKVVAHQSDGDTRYWGVDLSESPVLARLDQFARSTFLTVTGRPPHRAFIMMNLVDAAKCPQGSGGEWHRDSFWSQYKAFLYLVDVDRESQGPFCVMPGSNSIPLRAASALGWLMSSRKNHNQPRWLQAALQWARVRRQPVLAKAGVPFFANTSLIHRGLPITEGQRIAATVYLFTEGDPTFMVKGTAIA
jgi:hypothetical protein